MTPRQAIAWAELIVAVIIWVLYGWQVANAATGDAALGDALSSAIPYLILAVGASLIAGFGFWVMTRSPVLSSRTAPSPQYDEFGHDSRGEGEFIREIFAVVGGRYRHISPFADEGEAEVWKASGRVGTLVFVGCIGLGLVVFALGFFGVRLWESDWGKVALAVNLLAAAILGGLATHRGLFLSQASARPASAP